MSQPIKASISVTGIKTLYADKHLVTGYIRQPGGSGTGDHFNLAVNVNDANRLRVGQRYDIEIIVPEAS